jgi:tetratricopeptide (TPR) repeat protein
MKMIDGEPKHRRQDPAGAESRWIQRGILGAACMLVIGVYASMAQSGALEVLSPTAADTYYNLLVQGFRDGHLSLKKEVPHGLAQLADPYDPVANIRYRWPDHYPLHDLSYYKDRLYLYFGVTPALVLFWPYVALTGHCLFHRQAVAIFCAIGFLASVGLLRALWRRYFAHVSPWVVAACALALGLATGVPVLLSRCEAYEVAISCGYMLTMLALGAIWCALHEPERRWKWLAAASVAYGLAVGARPNLLFGAAILLVPVIQAWRDRRQMWALLMAAIGPITIIGLGLMLYNAMRFDSPLEFGQHYQLAADRQNILQHFSLHYLWFNFRVYFLQPARWSGRFPFVHEIAALPLPPGHGEVEGACGILTNIPLVWLALAVPLAWRNRAEQEGSILRWFVTAVALLFGICALIFCFYYYSASRFEVEFLPALLLLAVVGIFGLERALTDRPVWRRAARWGWGLPLGFSVVFNLLASVEHYAEMPCTLATVLVHEGRIPEAIQLYEQALRIRPDYAEAHSNLGIALLQAGKVNDAIGHYQQALRIQPDLAEAHNNLGTALRQIGKLEEAIRHYEQAVRIKPDYVDALNDLGGALLQVGRVRDAIRPLQEALRIQPDSPGSHCDLANALLLAGNVQDAISHYKQALLLKPDYVQAHNNLGDALLQVGRVQEAISHFQEALRIQPGCAEAQSNLARARALH